MKVLLINGSPHRDGNTFTALSEAAKALEAQGIVTEIAWIGNRPVRGCIACGSGCRLPEGRRYRRHAGAADAFPDDEHAYRDLAVLEHCLRACARTGR
nr:flavodoxin family protein [Succinivibrionaceae bacterium]